MEINVSGMNSVFMVMFAINAGSSIYYGTVKNQYSKATYDAVWAILALLFTLIKFVK